MLIALPSLLVWTQKFDEMTILKQSLSVILQLCCNKLPDAYTLCKMEEYHYINGFTVGGTFLLISEISSPILPIPKTTSYLDSV